MRKVINMWTGNEHTTLEAMDNYTKMFNSFIGYSSEAIRAQAELVKFGEKGYALIGNELTAKKHKEFEAAIKEANNKQG